MKPPGDQPDAATTHDGQVIVDAPPPVHLGGWRTHGGDAARSYRAAVAGPGTAATSALFTMNTSPDEFASLGTPVIDEAGNVYLMRLQDTTPDEVVSFDPTGHERWSTPIDAGWSMYDLDLGPDGNVYAVATMGSGDTMQSKIVVYRGSDGTALPGSDLIPGLYTVLMPPTGGIFGLTYTMAAGYGTVAYDAIGHQRWVMTQGGDAYAVSPAGDALAMIAVGSGNPAPPLELLVVDPSDSHELWHYTFAAGLGTPTLAIDGDGTVFAAVSENGSNLHVMRFAPGGQLQYDRTISTLTWPSRILVGHDAIAIGAQNSQDFAGIGLQKSDGMPPANSQLTCGDPQAIDSNDVVYWSCNNGTQATTPSGGFVASWTGEFSFQIVLGPDGSAYDVPAAYFSAMNLYKIK